MSAIKCAPYVDAAALLGTNLSEAKVDEIQMLGYDHVVLALDNDATDQAVKMQIRWRNQLPMCVFGLGQDIKDMNDEDFKKFIDAVLANEKSHAPR